MNGNSLGGCSFFWGFGWRGTKRGSPSFGEPKRSATAAEAGTLAGSSSRPDSEVVAKAKRRTFPMEYKIRILEEADAAATPGGVGALLRREGCIPRTW